MSIKTHNFDVVVIGGGPGGYIAAIRAAQLGLKTACIDLSQNSAGQPALGGTCTNVGCIPSKALLQSSEHYHHVKHHLDAHGIEIPACHLRLDKMLARKNAVVTQNNEGVLYLFKKNKVTFFHARAAFLPKQDKHHGLALHDVATDAHTATLTATHIIIATGSTARPLPDLAFDEKQILSNEGALSMSAVPAKLGIVGAGVIGLEMGSVWRRLGSEVTLLEAEPAFLTAVDQTIAKEAQKLFTKQGLNIHLNAHITEINKHPDRVEIHYTDAQDQAQTLQVDALIVSIGRIPNTATLNAPVIGLPLDERGFVVVNAQCQTSLPNIWAIGDVVRGPMLAHKAEEEGVAVAERIAGQHAHVDFSLVPWVIYTSPEIAWVGRTEQQLAADGIDYRVGSFPFLANGRARALGDTQGFVKCLADAKTDEILGIHIFGPMASELIAEAVLAMAFRASSEDIARICHAHPSLSEAIKEAALATHGKALNY